MRYRLDDLGWYHFELLVQSLLKAELGLGVESWGGTSDGGRDAYARGPLSFPDPNSPQPGPFLFQAKFVDGANAAGARSKRALIQAIEAECKRIRQRIENSFWRQPPWRQPTYYVLLTNVPLSSAVRATIESRFAEVMPEVKIQCLGALDICDLLDKHKAVARSFPELLSLRDLSHMLEEAVSRLILERSAAAISETQDIVPRFVATTAYRRSWQILEDYRFLVLDGPPEMGKTAIARMVSLVKLLEGWEAIDCRSSNDFFQLYKPAASQIFVVDDAFGRTEYDVTLGRLWERDLSKVLLRLNSSHWLILTSRKHILSRALRDLDLAGIPHCFPEPGELVVTAESLSVEEKARILYRHARVAGLPLMTRDILRREARLIVDNAHFTPFRIQILVAEVLPSIDAAGLTEQRLRDELEEAIRNPTDRMRKAFRKLPEAHQSLLIAILEFPRLALIRDLQERIESTCGSISGLAFNEIIEDLEGTFLKSRGGALSYVDWIHPSYRDLIIEELARDLPRQRKFIRRASPAGLKLAISESGGQSGQRRFPLMTSEECWIDLRNRAAEIIHQGNARTGGELIEAFSSALRESSSKETRNRIEAQVQFLCKETEEAWRNPELEMDAEPLRSYIEACHAVGRTPLLPMLQNVWATYLQNLRVTAEEGYISDIDVIERWCILVNIIETNLMTLFDSPRWQESYQEGLKLLAEAVQGEVDSSISGDADVYSGEAYNLEQLASWLEDLPQEEEALQRNLAHLAGKCRTKAAYYESKGQRETGTSNRSLADLKAQSFNVEALFKDL